MARPLRIEYPGATYHVMNRGLARSNIFLDNHDRQRFLALIGETSKLWKVEIYASRGSRLWILVFPLS